MPPLPLPYHPKAGEVLRCDYAGLVKPEMDKIRSVVVVSPKLSGRTGLCTVVPLSTTAPDRVERFHVRLDNDPDPQGTGLPVWVKCDMLMTVSFARLSAHWSGRRPDGKRNYLSLHVSGPELGSIRQAVLATLGMGGLWRDI